MLLFSLDLFLPFLVGLCGMYVGETVVKLLLENGVAEVLAAPVEPPFSNVKLAVRARGVEGGSVAGGVIAVAMVGSSAAFISSRICL